MAEEGKAWKTYEEVARYLLNDIAGEFGLRLVEGKQKVQGGVTCWEIDAKGVAEAGGGFVIVECRRYVKSRLTQEDLGAIVYRMRDTGASGAIVVTPLPLQLGAQKIADAEGVHSVRLSSEATFEEYIINFLSKIKVGICDKFQVKEEFALEMRDLDGNLIERLEG